MAPRTLQNSSLDSLWLEMSYTRARLAGDPKTADLAPTTEPYLAEIAETRDGQLRADMEIVTSQAQCDFVNDQLDDAVIDLADEILYIVRDRKSSRFGRYFKQTPYSIARLALDSELEIVRGWPEPLATEPEESLKAFAPRFTEIFGQAETAQANQLKAQNARTTFRVRTIEPLVGRINEARFKLYVQLAARADEQKLGKQWPNGFFKAKSRRDASEPEEVETKTPAKADAAG